MIQFTILGRPVTTTNSHRIVNIPTVKKDKRQPGDPIKYRPIILLSKLGAAYRKSAIDQLERQRGSMPTIEGLYRAEFDVYRAMNSGDVNNYTKGLSDALQKARVVRDDKLCIDEHVRKFTDKKNPRVEIRIHIEPHQGVLFPIDEETDDDRMESEVFEDGSEGYIPPEFMTPEERAAAGLS